MIIWVIASWLLGLIAFFLNSSSPIPIHWNIRGEADMYLPPWGIFIYPVMITFFYFLFSIVPSIDPVASSNRSPLNKKKLKAISSFLMLLLLFFQVVASLSATTQKINITKLALPLALSLFMIFVGNLLPSIPRNYFIGIRTPWTLTSEVNWSRTHRIGGYSFVLAGIISLVLLLFFPPIKVFTVEIILIVALSIFLFIISFLMWRKEQARKKENTV